MRLQRLIAIIMLLLQKDKVRGKELAELFEVSLRTIYRDIEAINAAGIPVRTVSGAGGGIAIMEQYKIEKGIFTVGDVSTMLTGLGVISDTLSGKEIASLLVKVKSMVAEKQIPEIDLKMQQVMFDLSPWMRTNGGADALGIIQDAMERKKTLDFSYLGRRGPERFSRVEPHRLVFKENQWYLQGYATEKQDFRLFKLRRFSALACRGDSFSGRVLPHPFAGFTDAMQGRMFPVKLLIDASALDKMLDYCSMGDITETEDGNYLVDFSFIDDDYGYGILMSFGDKLTCLEPRHVREGLKKRLNAALDRNV